MKLIFLMQKSLNFKNYFECFPLKKSDEFENLIMNLILRIKFFGTEENFGEVNYGRIRSLSIQRLDQLILIHSYFFICSIGQNVLIHCTKGRSRSPTIALSYIMKKYELSLYQSLKHVLNFRKIRPNFGFQMQLLLYSDMGCILDGKNFSYREFLLKNLIQRMKFEHCFKKALDVYLKKLSEAEENVSLTQKQKGSIYSCANCDADLFAAINLVLNRNQHKRYNDCNLHFIEPQKWMIGKNLEIPEYESEKVKSETETYSIYCYGCDNKLGSASFKLLFKCDCSSHSYLNNYLSFKIERRNVKKKQS